MKNRLLHVFLVMCIVGMTVGVMNMPSDADAMAKKPDANEVRPTVKQQQSDEEPSWLDRLSGFFGKRELEDRMPCSSTSDCWASQYCADGVCTSRCIDTDPSDDPLVGGYVSYTNTGADDRPTNLFDRCAGTLNNPAILQYRCEPPAEGVSLADLQVASLSYCNDIDPNADWVCRDPDGNIGTINMPVPVDNSVPIPAVCCARNCADGQSGSDGCGGVCGNGSEVAPPTATDDCTNKECGVDSATGDNCGAYDGEGGCYDPCGPGSACVVTCRDFHCISKVCYDTGVGGLVTVTTYSDNPPSYLASNTTNEPAQTDDCLDANTVREVRCTATNDLERVEVPCDHGCVNGRCSQP